MATPGGGIRQRRAAQAEGASAVMNTLKSFDVYPKLSEEFQVKTKSGGSVSVVALAVMAVLFLSEFWAYVATSSTERMRVDPTLGERLPIHINMTFPALTCAEVNLDAMDVSGEQQNGIEHDVFKKRLDAAGRPIGEAFAESLDAEAAPEDDPLPADYCGSCYGAEGEPGACCNTCEDLRKAYVTKGWSTKEILKTSEQCEREAKNPAAAAQKGEGCNIYGSMRVNKVAGNFHIALGDSHTRDSRHIHQFVASQGVHFNVSHQIHHLAFGEEFPGQAHPLDGSSKTYQSTGSAQYFLQVVPTVFRGRGGDVSTNQFSYTEHYKEIPVSMGQIRALPGIFFVYEISPFRIEVEENAMPFTHFLVNVCAIVGGVFTVAGIVDSVIFNLKGSRGD